MTAVRMILLAAAMSVGLALPAAAQQAGSGSAAPATAAPATAAPATAAPATEAPKAAAAPAEAPKAEAAPAAEAAPVVTMKAPDVNAMVQRLRSDLLSLTESARQGANDFLTRKNPYVITTDQLAVVAGGAVVGALVIDLMGGGGLATLAGAAVGGVAGHWLYTHPEDVRMPQMPEMPKMPALPQMPELKMPELKLPEFKLPPMPKLPTFGATQQG